MILTRIRKHIAFALLVVFFAPVVLQSVHVLRHHALGYKIKPSCLYYQHHRLDEHHAQADVVVYELEKTCHICEFQFAVNDLPRLSSFMPSVPALPLLYLMGNVGQVSLQLFYTTSPRAPPYT